MLKYVLGFFRSPVLLLVLAVYMSIIFLVEVSKEAYVWAFIDGLCVLTDVYLFTALRRRNAEHDRNIIDVDPLDRV